MKNILVLSFLFFFSYTAQCQVEFESKVAASPSKENTKLINKLISIAKFDSFYVAYCSRVIDSIGKAKQFGADKIKAQKSKINFEDFRFDVQNAYSFFSSTALKRLIERSENIVDSKDRYQIILNDPQISSNLLLRAEGYSE